MAGLNTDFGKALLEDADAKPKKVWTLSQRAAFVAVAWLGGGSCVYGVISSKQWGQCFYYSVNVGYSIGFGTLSDDSTREKLFSVLMILIGASCVTTLLSFFVTRKLSKANDVATKRLEMQMSAKSTVQRYFNLHGEKLASGFALLLWLGLGTAFGIINERFSPLRGVYFAVAALSTAGLQGIKALNGEWAYVFMGLYCMIGVPLFGLNVGQFSSYFIDGYIEAETHRKLHRPVTREEFNMVKTISGGGDDTIDKQEFFVLEMIRLGKTDLSQVEKIKAEFDKHDTSNDGQIVWAEIESRNRDEENKFAAVSKT